MRRIVIISPFQGQQRKNTDYARRALLDSVRRGESPFAPHLLYPQILNEKVKDREAGMVCGHAWIQIADAVAVYGDLGMSSGMLDDLAVAREAGLEVEMRMLGKPRGRPKKRAKSKKADQPEETGPAEEKQTKRKSSKKAASDGAPGKRRTREQLREDAFAAIADTRGGVTKSELRKQLHCSGSTLGRILDDLVDTDLVGLFGKGRTAKYRAKSKQTDAGVQGAIEEVVGG
jgi:hypothetical protein